MNRTIFESDHDLFRTSVREFVEREMTPNVPRWEEEVIVDKEVFRKAGRAGMLGMAVSEMYGGGGVDDFRFNVVIAEELMRGDAMGSGLCITLHNEERLSLTVGSIAHAQTAFDWTLEYVKERHAFGQPIGSFQTVKHSMAEMRTELDVAQTYVDTQVMALNAGELSAEEAAKAKWWVTELENKVISRCLQMFGGWGYMEEYPIARAFRDARVQTIYGGTTEVMKEIVGRSLGL